MTDDPGTEPDVGLAIGLPKPSRLDSARELVSALAELDPTGVVPLGLGLINLFLPSALEKRTSEFHGLVARRLCELAQQVTELQGRVNERLAVAALSEGTLAAFRSGTEEHLQYLANATAAALTTQDERQHDRAMILLRIAGNLTASHIRLLRMYANPSEVASEVGVEFEWRLDQHGRYDLEQVPAALDPDLCAEPPMLHALFAELEHSGLVGDEGLERIIDGGGVVEPLPEVVTSLGRELLTFVSKA